MRALIRRLVGFALLPALSMLASLVLLPLIARFDGGTGWSSMAVGQSIGALISIVAGLSWPVIGAQRVIETPDLLSRQHIFILAMVSRGWVIIALCIACSPVILLMTNLDKLTALLFMCTIALNGLSASWYFAGLGRPRLLVLNEGVTRLAGYLCAIVAMLVTHATLSYGICSLAFALLAVLLNWLTVVGPRRGPRLKRGELKNVYRTQATGTVSRILSSAHAYAPPTLLSLWVPGALALFTAIDGVSKSGMNAVTFFPSALVQWMQSTRGRHNRRQIVFVLILFAAVSVVVGWGFLGPFLMAYFYQGAVEIPSVQSFVIGITVALSLLVTSSEMLVFVPRHREEFVFRVEMITSALGLVAVVPTALAWGGFGAFTTYGAVAVVKLVIFLKFRRARKRV